MAEDSVDPLDDAALVERMRSGDRAAAVDYLWQRRDQILAFGRKRMRPDDHVDREPEDLFSTLLRRVDRIVTRGRFTAQSSKEADNLVFAVLRRAISNVFRNGQVRRKGQSRAAVSDTVEADLEFVDHERLRATVAELEPEEYDLFIGKLQGATSAEIAERLSTTEGAIRQRWRVLRERLTKNLMGGDSDE